MKKKNHFPTAPDAAERHRQHFPSGGNTKLNLTAHGGNPDTAHKLVGRPGLSTKNRTFPKKK